MFEVNKLAIENFNKKSFELLNLIKEFPVENRLTQKNLSERHIPTTITDADIIGDIKSFSINEKGEICERKFIKNNLIFGINKSDYPKFKVFCEQIQRTRTIRDKLSLKYIEQNLFSWMENLYLNGGSSNLYFSYLESSAALAIKKIRLYFPLAYISVESPFEFMGLTIENITLSMIDSGFPSPESMPETSRNSVKSYIEEFKTEFQGYGAIRIDLECEPDLAVDLGIQKATTASDLLGIYSGAVYIVGARCSSRLKGSEFIKKNKIIISENFKFIRTIEQVVDVMSMQTWQISKENLEEYQKLGFLELSNLAKAENPNDFQKSVLSMSFLYSKSAFTSDSMEKLVYILSALESIFLKNQSEPIQQNLGERLAIYSANALDERKKIVKNVRAVYDLRSRYLHHGNSSDEVEEIQEFFIVTWIFFTKILKDINLFKSKAEFLESIDDRKLS